jgi:Flp pilus assembly protein TadD
MNEDELLKRGKALLAEGKFEEALSCFEQAVFLEKNKAELWNCMGVALRSIGRYDEALECYNKALQIEPTDRQSS